MEIIFNVQFIIGIILILIGIILLYLFKQGRNKLIVQDQVRLTIRSSTGYFFILLGFVAMAIETISNLIPGFPSWGRIPLNLVLLGLVIIVLRNINNN